MIKILSTSDVITNSSSEVFVIKSEDRNKFPKEVQEFCTDFTEDNIFDLIWLLDSLQDIMHIPELFTIEGVNDLEDFREIYSDKEIFDSYKSQLGDVLNHSVIKILDEEEQNWPILHRLWDFINKHSEIEVKTDRI